MNHIKLSFQAQGQELKDTLAGLLSSLDISGLEETEDNLVAYIAEESYRGEEVSELVTPLGISFTVDKIAGKNWNEEWEKNFEPVIIEDFCSVRADFHPAPQGVQYDIVITPKMSFGTGHHATTALMMGRMREIGFRDKQVFDFGTGTGILAILAEMMGAASVLAIDNDEWSFENARENCLRNHCPKTVVQLATIESVAQEPQFDIILANINRHILLEYMIAISHRLKGQGRLLLSGILTEDTGMIRAAAEDAGLVYVEEKERQNWVCMHFQKA